MSQNYSPMESVHQANNSDIEDSPDRCKTRSGEL